MKILFPLTFLLFTTSPFAQEVFTGTTFKVDDVKTTTKLLPTNPFEVIASVALSQNLYLYPESLQNKNLASAYDNGFLATIHEAYAKHRPLVLSPDDVWLIICQGFGNHIVMNAAELETLVLKPGHTDKIEITIQDLAQTNNDTWRQLIDSFSMGISHNAQKDIVELLTPTYSTTTPIITTAYQATLMDATKSYFEYVGASGCGIPSITLTGTEADWQQIYDRIDQFNDYGLAFWTAELKPVLFEFLQAKKGNPNVEFWQSIYKDMSVYGVSAISGWVLKFYPYLRTVSVQAANDDEDEFYEFIESYKPNPFIYGKKYLLSTVDSGDLPKGIVDIDFVFHDLNQTPAETHHLTLHAGFIGIEQQTETFAVKPHIAWCITDQTDTEYERINWSKWSDGIDSTLEHHPVEWMPREHFSEIHSYPIFNPETNDSSIVGWKNYLELLEKSGLSQKDGSELEISIAWDGTPLLLSVSGPAKKNEAELKKFVESSGHVWKPAQIESPFEYEIEDETIRLVPVNYTMKIKI